MNATILPLLFLSGIFIPLGDEAPDVDAHRGEHFPVKPFADAMFGSAFSDVAVQTPAGPVFPFSFVWSDLLVVALGRRRPRARGPVLHLGAPQVASERAPLLGSRAWERGGSCRGPRR